MSIKLLCNIAQVSRSGYYKWVKRAEEPENDYDDYLLIKEIFERGKPKYGFRTIKMKLQEDKKIVMNHKKIQRIMKKTQEHRTFDNLLDRNFEQKIP